MTVNYATADGTATAPGDYTADLRHPDLRPRRDHQTVTVPVNGDTASRPNETFTVNLSNATGNATIADAQGVGTIVNDDVLQVVDAAGQVIVNGPVSHTKTSKSFVFKVSNLGTAPITINPGRRDLGCHRQRDDHRIGFGGRPAGDAQPGCLEAAEGRLEL